MKKKPYNYLHRLPYGLPQSFSFHNDTGEDLT